MTTALNQPLVSIVIPCYKGERFLSEAIESCLQQDYQNLEIIVVDDASPDRCAEIAETYALAGPKVRLIRRAINGGVATAFNTGFNACKGEFMARLAQDDYFAPHAIKMLVAFMSQNPDAGLVYCDHKYCLSNDGGVVEYVTTPETELFVSNNKIGLCLMWRRSVWEEVGGFDSAFDPAEDYDFVRRVHERFRLRKCPASDLFFARDHAEMGSLKFRPLQQIRQAQINARYVQTNVQARQILSAGFYEAAYHHRTAAEYSACLRCLMHSLREWPLNLQAYRTLLGLPLYWLSATFQGRASKHSPPIHAVKP